MIKGGVKPTKGSMRCIISFVTSVVKICLLVDITGFTRTCLCIGPMTSTNKVVFLSKATKRRMTPSFRCVLFWIPLGHQQKNICYHTSSLEWNVCCHHSGIKHTLGICTSIGYAKTMGLAEGSASKRSQQK